MIHTHGLTRRFGDLVAVDGLDLAVNKGEVFGFLGPNGAGKTATLRDIISLLPDCDFNHEKPGPVARRRSEAGDSAAIYAGSLA